jgi:hypothetical protein
MDPVKYAEAAFRNPLNVGPGWRALIVYEEDRFDFAEPFIDAAINLDLETLILKLPTPTKTRTGITDKIREEIIEFKPETCVNLIRYKDNETGFRGELLAAERITVKTVGHSPGGTLDLLTDGGLALDDEGYDEMYTWMDNLVAQTKDAESIHITAPNGTDFTVGLKDAFFRPETMNIPTGQVSCVPPEAGTLQGTIVCIHGGSGVFRKDNPVKFTAEKGSITDAECNDPELLDQIMTELNRDAGARMTNEIGIGANKMSKIETNPLDAEKNRGSISIGFGGPHNDSVAQLNLLIPGASATLTKNGEKIPLI